VDDDQDNLVDRYLLANNISDWQSVLSVRVYLLVRSYLADGAIDDKGKVYVMNSSGSQSDNVYQVPESLRYYTRKLYQSEVSIRNRLLN
ncbi:MAG: hypothetical protein ACI8O8_003167, partial [Oleiphilaceae bacterium]